MPACGRGQHDHAAGVAHEDGGRRAIVVGVEFFEGQGVGLERADDVGDAVVDFLQPRGERALGLAADDAGFDEPHLRDRRLR